MAAARHSSGSTAVDKSIPNRSRKTFLSPSRFWKFSFSALSGVRAFLACTRHSSRPNPSKAETQSSKAFSPASTRSPRKKSRKPRPRRSGRGLESGGDHRFVALALFPSRPAGLIWDCLRWRYETQFCETEKQDGFRRRSAPKPYPWKASRQTLVFGDASDDPAQIRKCRGPSQQG